MSSTDEVRQLTPDIEKTPVGYADHVDKDNFHKIHTSSDGSAVHMGPYTFRKQELINTFGGILNPGIHAPPPRRMGNPVAMGLSSFSLCAFVVSMCQVQARGVVNQSIIVGSCFFYGGVIELISGVMAYIQDNTFAGTALGCFGGFWLSYGAILCNAFGISSAYETTEEYNNALGFFLCGWVFFSFVLWICTFKSTWPFFFLFFFIWFWLLLLTIGSFIGNTNVAKGGGVIGLLASFTALYLVWAGISSPENSYVLPHAFYMPNAPKVE